MEQLEIQQRVHATLKKSRKRSYSAEPTSTVKGRPKRHRKRSLSPIPKLFANGNKINHPATKRPRYDPPPSYTEFYTYNNNNQYGTEYYNNQNSVAYGVGIPGKIVAIYNNNFNQNIGWLYSNYQKRNCCYTFVVQNQNQLLSGNQYVYFDHTQMSARNIRPTMHISLQQIQNNYLSQGFSIESKDKYIFKTRLNVIEDKKHEFKLCSNGFKFDILLDYMNGFINTKGGTIYFGIDDNGIVYGVQNFDRKRIDKLLIHIDSHLKKWTPVKWYRQLA
eukprot:430275_1